MSILDDAAPKGCRAECRFSGHWHLSVSLACCLEAFPLARSSQQGAPPRTIEAGIPLFASCCARLAAVSGPSESFSGSCAHELRLRVWAATHGVKFAGDDLGRVPPHFSLCPRYCPMGEYSAVRQVSETRLAQACGAAEWPVSAASKEHYFTW